MKRYPYTIDNGHGEQLTFTGLTHGPDGDRADAVVWPAGTPHKWWNAGTTELRMTGWFGDDTR